MIWKKKDLLKKQELAEELGMKFDEASELFSEETLETMRMVNITGGSTEGDNTVERCGCVENNVERCGCDESDKGKKCDLEKENCGFNCHTKGGDKCGPGSTTLPTTPPITEPTEDLPVTTTT